ncbi:uncharacterized protein METZ01_LOCUS270894, partial [marine metagenome]
MLDEIGLEPRVGADSEGHDPAGSIPAGASVMFQVKRPRPSSY